MHDQNFKNLILDYPRQALEFFAGEEAGEHLEQARIIPIRQEQLKERLGERFRELDTPLLVEWPDGRREAVIFIIEEESQTRRFSIHRLAHYCLDLSELMDTQRIVPVVIFLQPGDRQYRLRLGGDRHTYVDFHYLSIELKQLAASDYQDSDNIVARLNLPNMRHSPQQRLALYAAAQRGLLRLETNSNKQRKYIDFIDYYANLTETEVIAYQQQYLETEGEFMGLVQTLREEGRFIGVQQGMQQGRQQGEATILLRLLEKRFGTINETVRRKIESADAETLLTWSDRLLMAENVDEVFD